MNIWMKMFWAIGLYLALELGAFLIVGLVLNRTAVQLVLPYLAFAVPGVVILLLAWGLRTWEERGASPRPLALLWGLCVAVFCSAVIAATFYSGVELNLVEYDLAAFVFAGAVGAIVTFVTGYRLALARISSRARTAEGAASK